MKRIIFTILIFTILIPLSLYANKCNDGNTYEMNMCLKAQMSLLDKKIDTKSNSAIFKSNRDDICSNLAAKYHGGTYESICYGNCIIDLDEWYLEQLKD